MPSSFLNSYLLGLSDIFKEINPSEFVDFIEELKEALNMGSQIFICGNGGSASTASHFACDMNKGVSFGEDKRFKVICLNDNIPTVMAYANDVSYEDIFVEQLLNFMNKDDLVIGVSGSGNSGNVLKAIRCGNEKGAKTFGISGYGGGELKDIAQKKLTIHSNDMQKIEDMHLIIFHCAMQYFNSMKSNLLD